MKRRQEKKLGQRKWDREEEFQRRSPGSVPWMPPQEGAALPDRVVKWVL